MKTDLLCPDYYHIPKVVAEQVQPHEAFVWAVVYWFEKMKDGRCTASNVRIAEALPYKSSAISVANALTKLEDKGLLIRVFKDETKKTRIEIKVLVSLTRVSPTGDTGITHRCNRVSPTGEQISNITIKSTSNKLAPATQGAVINKLIEFFEPVNPSFEKLFKNNTQRQALERLVKKWGEEKVQGMIVSLESTNTMKYAPTITTPLDLENNLGKLVAYYKKQKTSDEVLKI